MTESELIDRVNKLERQNRIVRQGAALAVLLLALLVFIGQSGCNDQQPKQALAPAPVIVQPYQRFVRIASAAAMTLNWALDTKTGFVCRTWDWQLSGDKLGKNGEMDVTQAAPLCIELYKEYPDGK